MVKRRRRKRSNGIKEEIGVKRKELNWRKKRTRNERGILKRKAKEIEDKRE